MACRLIVFDLDFTLWDAGGTWCDHTCPPYRRVNAHVVDSEDSIITLYPDVKDILQTLSKRYTLATASRTGQPAWAHNLLQLFNIEKYFHFHEIYPGSKISHFRSLQRRTGIDFDEMIFFDDEFRNVEEVARLGVSSILVPEGINKDLVLGTL